MSEFGYDRSQTEKLIRERLRRGEDLQDVLAGVEHLAENRARAFGRPVTQDDVNFFLSMWCWNKFKPDPAPAVEADLVRARRSLFAGASRDPRVLDDLTAFVHETSLTWEPDMLYDAQRRSVGEFLELRRSELLLLRLPPVVARPLLRAARTSRQTPVH
jgi:hypothetical protein